MSKGGYPGGKLPDNPGPQPHPPAFSHAKDRDKKVSDLLKSLRELGYHAQLYSIHDSHRKVDISNIRSIVDQVCGVREQVTITNEYNQDVREELIHTLERYITAVRGSYERHAG